MTVSDELYGIYSFFDKLVVSEEYYAIELAPAQRRAKISKGVAAILSAAGGSAMFDAIDDSVAGLAFIGAGTPYFIEVLGFSDTRVAQLQGLWKGYKMLREWAQRDVIDAIASGRQKIADQNRLPVNAARSLQEIRNATVDLSKQDELIKIKTRIKATEAARKRFPPTEWWYP